jgi:dipeptidyl aminopeptidase/acylaminoacyl peptidase
MKRLLLVLVMSLIIIWVPACAPVTPSPTSTLPVTLTVTNTLPPTLTWTPTFIPADTATPQPSLTPVLATPTTSPTPGLSAELYRIAYSSISPETGGVELNLINGDGLKPEKVYPLFGETTSPLEAMSKLEWSSDGKELHFIADGNAYHINPDARYLEYIFYAGLPDFNGPYQSLYLSPTGENLAVVYQPDAVDVENALVPEKEQDLPALGLLDLGKSRWRKLPMPNFTGDSVHEAFSISSSSWSPDGKRLVYSAAYDAPDVVGLDSRFLVTFLWGASGMPYVDLFITTMNGAVSNLSRSQDPEAGDREEVHPVWSPDGNSIFYFALDQDGWGIERINPNGKDRIRLTLALDFKLSLSPDGSKFLFISDRDGAPRLYVMDAAGSDPVDLSGETLGYYQEWMPAWSPDGSQVLFACVQDNQPELCAVQADGTRLTRLTTGPATDSPAAWSPDGQGIAFISNFDYPATSEDGLYLMNADGTGLRRLASTAFRSFAPVWALVPVQTAPNQ